MPSLLFESIVYFYFIMNVRDRTEDGSVEDIITSDNSSFIDGALLSQPITNNTGRSSSGCITVDAVHPLFTSYRNIQTYHCVECNEDFETSLKSLNHHFFSKKHTPVSSCVYCHLPVYEYFHNGNREIYHKCEEELTRSVQEGDTIDVGENLLTSSLIDESSSNISRCIDDISSSLSDVSTENTSV